MPCGGCTFRDRRTPVLTSNRRAFAWGYGHYFVFGSAAAAGAGLAVVVDHALGKAHISPVGAGLALAVPVAVYLVCVWLVHLRVHADAGLERAAYPVAAALAVAAAWTRFPAVTIAGVLVVLTAACVRAVRRFG